MKNRLLLLYLSGYFVPPIAWNFFINFGRIFDGTQYGAILANPAQYVMGTVLLTVFMILLNRNLMTPRLCSRIPRFYLASLILYCALVPNAGLWGIPEVERFQIVFSNLFCIPIISLFTVPHIIMTTKGLEKYVNANKWTLDKKLMSLKTKLAIGSLFTIFGAVFLLFIFNLVVGRSFGGDVNVSLLVARNLTVLLISLGIATLNFTMLISQLSVPINQAVTVLRDIAQGEGDISRRLSIYSQDEIGEMARYLNSTLDKITALVIAIRNQTGALSGIGSELSASTSESGNAVSKINAAINDVRIRATQQTESVASTNRSMLSITERIKVLDGRIDEQATGVTQSSSSIEEMLANIASVTATLSSNAENVSGLAHESDEGRSSLQEVSDRIREIARESEGLLEISGVIERIASQTNLLSMNAAIEAAHAGASGRGFAVVADEIRKLAETSATQSKSISASLKKIKNGMNAISQSTDDVLNRFESINERIKTVSDRELGIKNAMDEQGSGSNEILLAVGQLNEITSRVKEDSAEMLHGGQEVLSESKTLEGISLQVSASMAAMATSIEQISAEMAHVDNIAKRNNESVAALSAELGRFKT